MKRTMHILPWLALATHSIYRMTWGSCDCSSLSRRLLTEQREKQAWESIARSLFFQLREAQAPSLPDSIEPYIGKAKGIDS